MTEQEIDKMAIISGFITDEILLRLNGRNVRLGEDQIQKLREELKEWGYETGSKDYGITTWRNGAKCTITVQAKLYNGDGSEIPERVISRGYYMLFRPGSGRWENIPAATKDFEYRNHKNNNKVVRS